MQKGIALATCMAIVMGLFTGCGNKNDLQDPNIFGRSAEGMLCGDGTFAAGGMEGQEYQSDFPFG